MRRPTVGILSAIGPSRTSLPTFERRSGDPSGLPPKGGPDRGAYFRGVPGLLCAREPGAALERFGAGTDREVGTGKDVSDANDRRASADHRRTRSDPDPLHSAGNRTEDSAGEIEANFARTAAPENHRHATREQEVL